MATATGNDLLPTRSHELLQRADAELVAAQFSSEAWERFSHAHLAALRGGAALLAVRGRPGGPSAQTLVPCTPRRASGRNTT